MAVEQRHEYDFSRPINIYEIKDIEAKRLFDLFTRSVMDIFSFEGRERLKGSADYAYYDYYAVDLGKKTREGIVIDEIRYITPEIPEKFFDLLLVDENDKLGMMTKGTKLKEAQDEAIQIIANYMALKYKKNVNIVFDGLYYLEKYEPVEGLFNQNEYDRHIKLMMPGNEPVDEFVTNVTGRAYNILDARLETKWNNGKVSTENAKWDIASGEIIEVFSEDTEEREKDSILIAEQNIVFDDIRERVSEKLKENGESVLVAPTLRVVEAISENIKLKKKEMEAKKREERHTVKYPKR
jgi:hypothetical protein